MTQFSLIDRIQNDKAIRTLWSPNPAERAMAATFLRLGDQLEAQWESNKIQRRLCDIAMRTNDMLSDMCGSLADLTAGQERTNELLAKSLAVQTDHYMLEKRQRVLKDALFRWNDLLTTGEGMSDPHWVLVASRTFLEFLKTWDFTTEDLEDTDEKRSLLEQTKRAKSCVKGTPEEVTCEVNVFQTLYAECEELLANPVRSSANDGQELPDLNTQLKEAITRSFPRDAFPLGLGVRQDIWGGPPYIAPLSAVMFKQNEAAMVRGTLESKPVQSSERVIIGIYGKAEFVGNCRLAYFTEKAWYERTLNGMSWSDPIRHDYASGDSMSLFDDYKLYSPRPDAAQLTAAAKELPRLISSLVAEHASKTAELRHSRESRAAKELHDYESKKASALSHINAYLDAHPLVKEFYPRIVEQQTNGG